MIRILDLMVRVTGRRASYPVAVIGGGVIGLSCAAHLARQGYPVVQYQRPAGRDRMTSVAAAAFWYPYMIEVGRNDGHSEESLAYPTLKRFLALAKHPRETGVSAAHHGVEYFGEPISPSDVPRRWWHRLSEVELRWLDESELPRSGSLGVITAGCRFRVPTVNVERYLEFMRREIDDGGNAVRIEREIESIEDLAGRFSCVVNCTGLDARRMANDPTVEAYRGQVVRLYDKTYSDLVFIEQGREYEQEPLYIVPRPGAVVLGGTLERVTADDLSLSNPELVTPDPLVTERILTRCAALFPECLGSVHYEAVVGLRPKRTPLRLEFDSDSHSAPVVHCYGHGGAGVTLSWGSALRVGEIVAREIGRGRIRKNRRPVIAASI